MTDGSGELQFLRDTRRRLAELWLSAPAEEVPSLYGSELGRFQRLLWASPALYFEPLDGSETELADRAARDAQPGVTAQRRAGPLLATMLYRPAHEVGLNVDWPA